MTHRKLLSFLLCAALICTLAGFAFVEGHDHDHGSEMLEAVLASPIATITLGDEQVPLSDGADAAPQPESTVAPHEHQWVTHVESRKYDCYYGWVEQAYDECTICGIKVSTAARPESDWPKGKHQMVKTIKDNTCPSNPGYQETCSVCGFSQYTAGGHKWGEWVVSEIPGTCGGRTLTRTCDACKATETKTEGNTSHTWRTEVLQEATCTQAGKGRQVCAVCGAKGEEVVIPKLSHSWGPDDGDCTTPTICTVCGAKGSAYSSHNFTGAYTYDENGHWQQCSRCSVKSNAASHTRSTSYDCTMLGKCTVCGAPAIPSGQSHDFSKRGSTDATYHIRRCSHANCNAQIKEEHSSSAPVVCGVARWCDFCGCKISDSGTGNHSYGGWTATASGHSRTCSICGHVEHASHKAKTTGSGGCTDSIVCTVCGYVISPGYSGHSFGVWMSNGSTHYRVCTHPGCTAMQSSAHTGGAGTCASAPVCAVCGASYGSKSAGNHVGGTEVRNYKAPQIGVAGYTGDTYCLGCGKVLTRGNSIAMLTASHTHQYGDWMSDSGHHWKICGCGEREDYAAHSFANGKCTVCGAADPDYKVCAGGSHVGGTELRDAKAAEVGKTGYTGDLYCTTCGAKVVTGAVIPALEKGHEHAWSVTWRSDGASHWKDCTCGETAQKAAHKYVNGICSVCGAADPNAKAEEAHVHNFGPLHSNGQYHWRECTVCGFQAEKAAHVMVNGSCMECGYTPVAVTAVKDVTEENWYYEPVKQALEAGILSGGKTGAETTSFKPEEKVALSDVVDALYRLAGSPMAASETKFTDVKSDDYYASAATWVTENDIVAVEGNTFDGTKGTTLQEMVTFLWRFARTAGWNVPAAGGAEETDEAAAAMSWASDEGLTAGLSGETTDGAITRAEAAAILVNFMGMIEANGLPGIETGIDTAA